MGGVTEESFRISFGRGKQKGPGDLRQALMSSGSPARTRTTDPVINSHLLYQLSYWGIARPRMVEKRSGLVKML